MTRGKGPRRRARLDAVSKRTVDLATVVVLAPLLLPLVAVVAAAVKLDSRGPVFYRVTRVGRGGREFRMLKFRKMVDGASGPALTAYDDERFTRLGRWLGKMKLDELPQVWNVLRGEMSLVGPRPEDPGFVALRSRDYAAILRVKPGITGLTQLAFAREGELLDPDDRVGDYVQRLLPKKTELDRLYARRRSVALDLRILWWTAVVVLLGREVAVNRESGAIGVRRRPAVRRESRPDVVEAES